MNWQTLRSGAEIGKQGRYKVLEVWKRSHGGYCCLVYSKGELLSGEGYFTTSLPTKKKAKSWGIDKAKTIGII